MQGAYGRWSPDGQTLLYPVLVRGQIGTEFYTHLDIIDRHSGTLSRVSGPNDAPVHDGEGAWSPDGQTLAVGRSYLDERYTPGLQLYLLDRADGEVEPLVIDARYNHAALHWDAAGQRLVFQRFPVGNPDGLPSIWVYDRQSGQLQQVADNAMMPQWIP